MKPTTIFAAALLMLASASGATQDNLTVRGVLSDQGKPFARGLVVLQRIKDEKCARLWGSGDLSPKNVRRVESCTEDLPWMNTDEQGKYSYGGLAPGWYDIRFLWFMDPVWPGEGIECWTGDWVVKASPRMDLTGKYNAFAQGKPFELRSNDSKQVNFDYQSQINRGPGCATYPQSQPAKTSKARILIPGSQGVLELDPGPSAWQSRVRLGGTVAELEAMARADHLLVTAFLQKVTFAASPEKCRDERWPNAENALRSRKARLDHLQKTSQEGVARVEFMLQGFQGEKLQMKDVHVYLGSRDLCAEVHLSKVFFVPDDQKLFDEVLATVRLRTDDSAGQEQPNDYFAQASRFYLQHNYAAAAESYQKALDLEKQKRTLNPTLFRVLVDNLGMSYGLTGNLSRAKETFEYGIAEDPEYPLFYYNMACTYGEMGKRDESLAQLRLAYKYKANMIPGESFPDPLKDDSFRNFVKDKKFVDAVQDMQRP